MPGNINPQSRNRSRISLHALHVQATRLVEDAPVLTKSSLSSISAAFSSLYAVILVTFYLAFTFTEVVTFPRFHHYLESYGFYIYVYGVSNLFFIYILSISIWSEKKKQVLNKFRIVLNHKSHGCLPARIGIVFFGIGALMYLILELIAFIQAKNSLQCYNSTDGANSVLGILFVILQAFLIFMYPRLNLDTFNFLDGFGTMHVVATNLIVWVHAIITESLHEFEEAAAHQSSLINATDTNVTNIDLNLACDDFGQRMKMVYELNHKCDKYKAKIFGYPLSKTSHFLYPFIIEFALIGASVFFVMWRHIGRHSHPMVDQPHLDVKIHRPRPVEFSDAEYFSKLTKILMNTCAIFTLSVGIWQIQYLDDVENHDKAEAENRNLDTALLRFTSFFAYLYQCFTIITGIFNANVDGFPVQLHDVNAVISTIQITLQLVFILDLRWKHLPTSSVSTKPGRQVAMFLFLYNIGMWLVFTFEIQKVRSSLVEAQFYGVMPWVIIQRVTLPLTIFFRFHSAVVSIEMWKNAYKTHHA
eukprot:maker-scaffold280_size224562-snap-gene-0.11 protein:Tk08828 transcript:maker-scaffold280_size224562-snap-gene-0.11-mRNA-1 annotation:"protein otpl-8"